MANGDSKEPTWPNRRHVTHCSDTNMASERAGDGRGCTISQHDSSVQLLSAIMSLSATSPTNPRRAPTVEDTDAPSSLHGALMKYQ